MARREFLILAAVLLVVPALATDISGKWTSEFDSQIGRQHYTWEFKVQGESLTGTATQSERGTTEIKEGKVKGDEVSFVEVVQVQGQELRISHKGKVSGDEIRFTRKVGDFTEYEIVAKRAK